MKEIAVAMKAIPGKKDKLREAFDSVQSYSSSLATFALQWKDLEDHFATIEKSFDERFKALQDHLKGEGEGNGEGGEDEEPEPELEQKPHEDAANTSSSLPTAAPDNEATPRPDLRSFCANMDAKGLRAYISENLNDLVAIREEFAPAIRCAPDPALLVLDAMEGFYPSSNPNPSSYSKRKGEDGEIRINRWTYINLLEKLHLISPKISASVREKAKKLASDWKSKIPKSGDFVLEVFGLLQLIASYNLVSEFPLNTVMDLFISVSRRKQAVDLIKSLGLTDKLPDLIQKLNSKGRQLDAVKFVYALDMVEKFPPVPLLKAYIAESKKIGQGVRKKGNNSLQAQNEATAKEMGALRSVLKAVEEYGLEAEYPREDLVKRIAQLEQKKAVKKRSAASAAASNSKPQQQQQQKSNKRSRPSSTSAAEIASNTYPPMARSHPQLGLADRAPFMGVSGPHGPAATGSVYNHGGANLSGSAVGHGAGHSPPVYSLAATGALYSHGGPNLAGSAVGHGAIHGLPRSYYLSESVGGTSSLYDRQATYNGYNAMSGLPPSYGSSGYP